MIRRAKGTFVSRLSQDIAPESRSFRLQSAKEAGALRSRLQLDRALTQLRRGDTLVVWKLDRLRRSLRDLLDVAEILREQGVALRSLTEHIDRSIIDARLRRGRPLVRSRDHALIPIIRTL